MADISHNKQFIFIHIPKNAGSSVSTFLRDKTDSRFVKGYNMHTPGTALREHFGPDVYDNYFKFTFVRNPWDRIYSLYRYRQRRFGLSGTSLLQYLNMKLVTKACEYQEPVVSVHEKPQVDWFTDKYGHLMVDFIGRYETLDNDFNIICERIGIPPKALPKVNVSSNKKGYRQAFDEKTKKIVAERFAKDIEMFGYEF